MTLPYPDESSEVKPTSKYIDGFSRPLGQTEENWMNCFHGGTGRTVLGVLMRRQLDRSILQAALDSVLESHPKARCLLVNGPTVREPLADKESANCQEKRKPAFLVPEIPQVKVKVVTGWTPRISMEALVRLKDVAFTEPPATSALNRVNKVADGIVAEPNGLEEHPGKEEPQEVDTEVVAGARIDTCFEIGRRESPSTGLVDGETLGQFKLGMCQDKWLQIVEANMNECWEDDSDEAEGCEAQGSALGSDTPGSLDKGHEAEKKPLELFQVILHRLPPYHSLVLVRMHTMLCDIVSVTILLQELLRAIVEVETRRSGPGEGGQEVETPNTPPLQVMPAEAPGSRLTSKGKNQPNLSDGDDLKRRLLNPKCVEDCVPRSLKDKPFWAHGLDVIGYGLGSRRHALLPFKDALGERRSQLIRSGLSREDTDLLLEACIRENTSLYGVMTAAALMATTKYKELGKRAEHYGVITFVNLRPYLRDELDEKTLGFYHSALMNTHHVSETTELWDLARRCHGSVEHAISKRKHFTDMGDLNMLMGQAMQHPHLTPAGSLRTSHLVMFKDSLCENMDSYAKILQVEDYVGCSSIHGVGPTVAIFSSVRKDGLHMSNVYPAPLFSRSQMRWVIIEKMKLLLNAIGRA